MPRRLLVDTNVLIEAVRTGCWRPITGQLALETVEACRREAVAGSESSIRGYVRVSEDDLARLRTVHRVDAVMRASFKLAYEDADALDVGEHDLFALAHANAEDEWALISPDKAAIRAAMALGIGDGMVSLEDLVGRVGARPKPALKTQFTSQWLVSFRSRLKLEDL